MSNTGLHTSPDRARTLLLITHTFPYGVGEAFLESEMKWLAPTFSRIIILTKGVSTPDVRFKEYGFISYVEDPRSSPAEKALAIILAFRHLRRVARYIREEISMLRSRRKRITPRVISRMIHDLLKALSLSRTLQRILKKHVPHGDVLLYSYWLTSSALATTFVRPSSLRIKRIARAHRVELYEEVQADGYLSFRQTLAHELDRIYAISADGVQYLRKMTSLPDHARIQLARLGTTSIDMPSFSRNTPPLLVSCSFMAGVKRIDLIIDALNLLPPHTVHWIHFGDGPMKTQLEEQAKFKLEHITWSFYGAIRNEDLLTYYQTQFVDLFVNTSESEGIPVSIMEAQSLGIPTIAPHVGGVAEIVSEKTGILLPGNPTPAQIAAAILHIAQLPGDQYQELRKTTRKNWEDHYNAQKNYADFRDHILQLLDGQF
jgi:glycosyltransferase involved in cell wall biosynthesis